MPVRQQEDFRLMLQGMLAESFGVVSHYEKKEIARL